MNKQVKVSLLLGGALVSLASWFPLTAYAATESKPTVTAIVNPVISIDAASGFEVKGNAGEVMTGQISTTIKANTKYTVGFKVADTYSATHGTDMTATGVSDTIPASTGVAQNVSAWGIKAKTGLGDTANAATYTAMTTTNQVLFTSTGNNDGSTPIKFDVGISTAPSISAGSYSVDLTVTAAAI